MWVGTKPGLWTGLITGLWTRLWTGLWTRLWTGLWTRFWTRLYELTLCFQALILTVELIAHSKFVLQSPESRFCTYPTCSDSAMPCVIVHLLMQ